MSPSPTPVFGPRRGWRSSQHPCDSRDRCQHGGRRLVSSAEQTDRTGIYLTQQSPSGQTDLRHGAGQGGVKAATLGGMSPTGATIILEWADKEGKWTAAGAYADGLYGDSDWQRVATKDVRAPLNAGYAVIFLSLRATGTAWFDDVELKEIKDNVVLREPAFGARVDDNTPRFTWQCAKRGEALLELSPEAGFPAGKTLRLAGLKVPTGAVAEPLTPGRWYWRVSLFEGAVTSAAWEFEQTAPVDRDCTEPQIEPDHVCLSLPRQAVTVRFHDNVGIAIVKLVLDDVDVSRQATMGRDQATITPPADWQAGLHRLEVAVADAAGNQATRRLYLNCLQGATEKRWLLQGGVSIGAQPHFLLGMYGVRLEDVAEMAAAGIDFVHNYTWDGPGTNETATQYLDACGQRGLQAFIGFDRARLQAEDEDFVAERVGQLSHHPALLAWYLFDEPDLPHQYVPPDQLRRLYGLIRRLDPLHPVVVTVAQHQLMPEYHDSYDVYWSMDYSTPAKNVANLDFHRRQFCRGAADVHRALLRRHSASWPGTDARSGRLPADPGTDACLRLHADRPWQQWAVLVVVGTGERCLHDRGPRTRRLDRAERDHPANPRPAARARGAGASPHLGREGRRRPGDPLLGEGLA